MSEKTPMPDVTRDDKLWALLAYLLSPLIPLMILFTDDKRQRPFLRAHLLPALILGFVNLINAILSIFLIYWGIKAFKGEKVEIPVLSNFIRDHGWV
ncbi:MAG TPA: hypothetical protein VJ436_05275 [Anaerolineales bacterium]|nr:hypothetical protein [Anaerolineales bacterium]